MQRWPAGETWPQPGQRALFDEVSRWQVPRHGGDVGSVIDQACRAVADRIAAPVLRRRWRRQPAAGTGPHGSHGTTPGTERSSLRFDRACQLHAVRRHG